MLEWFFVCLFLRHLEKTDNMKVVMELSVSKGAIGWSPTSQS